MRDPRPYQIATLALLLAYGVTRLGFDVPAVGDGNRTILDFRPAVPSSPLTDSGQC